MAKFKVAVQKQVGVSFDLADSAYSIEREALDPIGAEIVEIDASTDEEFIAGAKDADAIIARNRRITEKIINGLEKTIVIGLGSVGADPVDVAAATKKGIVVTNVPDVFIEEVADHAIMLLLSSHRLLRQMGMKTREGKWSEGRPSYMAIPRLWGQTLGLISFGNVARAVARRAQPFGLQIIAYDPYINETRVTGEGVEPVTSMMELMERSDFVSMHAPWRDETTKLMKAEHFKAMKNTALFINTGRGRTVDEPALIKALQDGEIAGAGLDVFWDEPVATDNPLLDMDNVIVTPHIASATARMMPETRRRLGRELALVLEGKWPRAAVNPNVLPSTNLERWQPVFIDRGPGG